VNSPDAASLARHDSLGYQVNHLGRLLAQGLRRRTEGLGVVPGQFAQLLALYEEDGLTQRELCDRVRIEQPTMASTLQRMERDGLVERVPDPDDRRRARVMLTDQSRRIETDLTTAARKVNSVATEGLSKAEVEAFMATLDKLISNLESRHAS